MSTQAVVRSLAVVAGIMCLSAQVASGQAVTPIRVLCSNAIRVAFQTLVPAAERSLGRKISVEYSASSVLQQSIEGGAPFDMAILTPNVVEALIKSGKIAPGSLTELASVNLAVGARTGSPRTDVSTATGMKQRLLAAKSMTWTDGGASSAANAGMLQALGIAEQLKSRVVLQAVPGRAAEAVAHGENELVLAPVSEILGTEGMQVLGLFPQEFQRPVVIAAGIAASTKNADAARSLVTFLTSAAAAPAIEASGATPAAKTRK